jgi:hypothetical protein
MVLHETALCGSLCSAKKEIVFILLSQIDLKPNTSQEKLSVPTSSKHFSFEQQQLCF